MRRPDASFTWAKATASTTDAASGGERMTAHANPAPPQRLPLLFLQPQTERDFAAKQNQSADTFIAAEDAAKGMTEMSEKFKEMGGEIYLPAAE